jgi:hypothetical protein
MKMVRVSRGQRSCAFRRLLAYARAESEELGLLNADKLLGAAALAVSDELDRGEVVRSYRASKREVTTNVGEEASESADKWNIAIVDTLAQIALLFIILGR